MLIEIDYTWSELTKILAALEAHEESAADSDVDDALDLVFSLAEHLDPEAN